MPLMLMLMLLLMPHLLLPAGATIIDFNPSENWELQDKLSNFAVFAPSSVQPGRPFRLSASAVSGARLSSLEAALDCRTREGEGAFKATTNWRLRDSDEPELHTISTDGAACCSTCLLQVTVRDSSGSELNSSHPVTVSPSVSLTLIQTDKSVYQPAQTVKFRVVSLDDQLRAKNANVTVMVKDSRRNLVDRMFSRSSLGVAEGEFRLSDRPNLGEWTLVAVTSEGRETQKFWVEKYTLPKLELELRVPEFVHTNDSHIRVQAMPRYTFGRVAIGTVRVNLTIATCVGWRRRWSSRRRSSRRRSRSCESVMTASAQVGGAQPEAAAFNFSLADWRASGRLRSRQQVSATATFTEKFTGESASSSRKFTIHDRLLQLKVSAGARFCLPGMRLPIKVQLQRPNGLPYPKPELLTVSMRFHSRGRSVNKQIAKSVVNGTFTANATIPLDLDSGDVYFTVRSESGIAASTSLPPMRTKSSEFVHASVFAEDKDSVMVTVNKSASVTGLRLALVSDGLLLELAAVKVTGGSAIVRLSGERLLRLRPEFTALAVGFHGNELLAAGETYEFLNEFSGLSITPNVSSAQPQQPVSLRLNGSARSLVFVSGIDHSVNLIRTGHDVTAERVKRAAKRLRGGADNSWDATAGSEIQRAGLVVLTDFRYVRKENPMILFDGVMERNDVRPVAMATGVQLLSSRPGKTGRSEKRRDQKKKKQQQKQRMRKFFPETFIWHAVATDADGVAYLDVRMPDTVTSWDVTAFATHESKPLQTMQQPLQLVTFKKFFIRPALPYALVRGETLVLKIVAFNYHDVDMTVNVTLVGDSSFRARAIGAGNATSQALTVRAGSANATAFRVTPLGLTPLNLTVIGAAKGDGVIDGDAVQRLVRVRPEGSPQFRTVGHLLNATASETFEFVADFPDVDVDGRRVVTGSEVTELRVVGDILGSTLENMGRLLRMPYGCGEQNMVNFAPAAHVHRYLLRTGQATEQNSDKALLVMKTGYQRELTYKRRDGSFSAFGDNDKAGSTWLTAFVLACFAQASEFIAVDADSLTGKSLEWLLNRQQPDGMFTEPPGGRVIHTAMQGGSGSGFGMSAFVCSSLLHVSQAAQRDKRLQSPMWQRLHSRLQRQLRTGLLAIFTRYSEDPEAFKDNDLAVSAFAVWREFGPQNKVSQFMWRHLLAVSNHHGNSRSWGGDSVETSAYALMTSLLRGSQSVSLQAVRWLLTQQGDLGGFGSTQDTVVGVQALAEFAAASGAASGIAHVTASWQEAAAGVSFQVDGENRQLLQRQLIGEGAAARVSSVRVRATGSGVVVVSLARRFHLSDPPAAFITTSWTRLSGFRLRLREHSATVAEAAATVCVAAESAGAGMHILTITHPTGFIVHSHTLPSRVRDLQLVETDEAEIVFYLSELSSELCLTASWKRDVPVLNLKPQRISVQDYYRPERQATLFHMHRVLSNQNECEVCPDCPQCHREEL